MKAMIANLVKEAAGLAGEIHATAGRCRDLSGRLAAFSDDFDVCLLAHCLRNAGEIGETLADRVRRALAPKKADAAAELLEAFADVAKAAGEFVEAMEADPKSTAAMFRLIAEKRAEREGGQP